MQLQIEKSIPLEPASFATTALEPLVATSIHPIGDETAVITRIRIGEAVDLTRLQEVASGL